jgi:hypothetical protein
MSASPTTHQKTGIAGEFFVAAELAKRNFQVAISLGNAKGVDLLVTTPNGKKTFEVEVKTLRKQPNCFTLHSSKIKQNCAYILVMPNALTVQIINFYTDIRIQIRPKPTHHPTI